MKKLAIVALALVLAMTFVRCGNVNMLKNSSWDTKWSNGTWARFEFLEDDVCNLYEASKQEMLADVVPAKLTWTAEGDVLTLKFAKSGNLYGAYTVLITANEMTWTQTEPEDKKDTEVKLTRVTDAK